MKPSPEIQVNARINNRSFDLQLEMTPTGRDWTSWLEQNLWIIAMSNQVVAFRFQSHKACRRMIESNRRSAARLSYS